MNPKNNNNKRRINLNYDHGLLFLFHLFHLCLLDDFVAFLSISFHFFPFLLFFFFFAVVVVILFVFVLGLAAKERKLGGGWVGEWAGTVTQKRIPGASGENPGHSAWAGVTSAANRNSLLAENPDLIASESRESRTQHSSSLFQQSSFFKCCINQQTKENRPAEERMNRLIDGLISQSPFAIENSPKSSVNSTQFGSNLKTGQIIKFSIKFLFQTS